MKTLIGLLPYGIALAVAGVAIWLLLERNIVLGRWLLGALLVGHGLVHLLFLIPRPETAAASAGGVAWPFDLTNSWLATRAGLDPGLVRVIAVALIGVLVVGFVLAGLAAVGVLVPAGWWQGLVVVAAGASALLLALAFEPGLLLGLAIDAVLVWLALIATWRPDAA